MYSQETRPQIENIETKSNININSSSDIEITGIIKDSLAPIPGVNVIQKNTSNYVQTDVDGNYSIKIPIQNFNKQVYIIFSFIGMEDQEIEIFKDSKHLNIEMKNLPNLSDSQAVLVGAIKRQKPMLFKRIINSFKKKNTSR